MIWKRSKIVDVQYKFPLGYATIIFQTGRTYVGSGSCMQSFVEDICFDSEDPTIENLIGKEIVYTLDEKGNLDRYCELQFWEGPDINPESEIDYTPPSIADEVLNYVSEINPEAVYPIDMKEAIIGYVERNGMQPQILLDKNKCIHILEGQGMSPEEAVEFFEFKTLGFWVSEGTPCFATLHENI